MAIAFAVLCTLALPAHTVGAQATPDPLPLSWVRRTGESVNVTRVQPDLEGNTLVFGASVGGPGRLRTLDGWEDVPADAGGGGQAFIARFAPDDQLVQLTTFGGLGSDEVTLLAPLPGGDVVIVASLGGPLPLATNPPTQSPAGTVLMRIAADGSPLWAVNIASLALPDASLTEMAASSTGIAVVVTAERSTPPFPAGFESPDGFVERYALDGTLQWVRQFGGSFADDRATGVQMASDGGVLVTGVVRTAEFTPSSLTFPVHAAGSGFVGKYSSVGDLEWVTGLPAAQQSTASDPILASDGSVTIQATSGPAGATPVVIPTTGGPVTLGATHRPYLARLAADGQFTWAVAIADGSDLDLAGIGEDVVLLSSHATPGDGATTSSQWAKIRRFDGSGALLFEQDATQRLLQTHLVNVSFREVAVDAGGAVMIAGEVYEHAPVTFGSGAEAMTLDHHMHPDAAANPPVRTTAFLARYGGSPSPRNNLTLQVDASPPQLAGGEQATVSVTVANEGPAAAIGVFVDAVIPSQATVASSTASQGSVAGTRWIVGDLAPGASATLMVTADLAAGTACTVTWTARAGATVVRDNDERDSFAPASLFVIPPDDPSADVAWAQSIAGAGANSQTLEDRVEDLDVGTGDRTIAVGNFGAIATFGRGPSTQTITAPITTNLNRFVARYRSDGELTGVTGLRGGAFALRVESLDDGGWVIAGGHDGAVSLINGTTETPFLAAGTRGLFVSRFDSAGSLVWTRTTPGLLAAVQDVVLGPGGEIVVLGKINAATFTTPSGPVTPPLGPNNFIARFAPDGTPGAAFYDAVQSDQISRSIAVLPDGDLIVGGTYSNTVDIGQNPPRIQLLGPGAEAGYVARIDGATGNAEWATSIMVAPKHFSFTDLVLRASGDIVVTANEARSNVVEPGQPGILGYNGRVLAYSTDGSLLWNRRTNDTGSVLLHSVDANSDGTIIAGGQYRFTTTLGSGPGVITTTPVQGFDMVALRFDATGGYERAWTGGGGGSDDAGALALLSDGAFVAGGQIFGNTPSNFGTQPEIATSRFGATVLCQRENHDGFVASFQDATSGWLQGTVRDAGGAGLAGVTVTIMRDHPQWIIARTVKTRGDGTYLVSGLSPGTYRIRFLDGTGRVQTRWWPDAPTYLTAAPVVVTQGVGTTASASLPARPDGAITGRVLGPGGWGVGQVVVQVLSPDGFVGSVKTGLWGGFTYGGLPPGTYYVRVIDPFGRWVPRWWRATANGLRREAIVVDDAPVSIEPRFA